MYKIIIYSAIFMVLLTPIILMLRPEYMKPMETYSYISISLILGIFYSKLSDIHWLLKNNKNGNNI